MTANLSVHGPSAQTGMTRTLSRTCVALIMSASASAQVTSIESSNPAPKGHDPNRIVCETFDTTGTRLGRRKVCKTVLEWQQLTAEQREGLQTFQRMATSVGCPNGQMECDPPDPVRQN